MKQFNPIRFISSIYRKKLGEMIRINYIGTLF